MSSIPIIMIFFLILYEIEMVIGVFGKIPTLLILALLNSSSSSFYFMGFHLEFAKFSESHKSARQYGIVRGFSTAASVAGPFFGGLIIEFFSFNFLFCLVVLCLFLSVIPLFFSKELHQPFRFSYKKILRNKKNGLPFMGEGIRFMAATYFWPVLLFVAGITLGTIGGIFSFSSFLLAVFTVYLGKKTTEYNKHKMLKIGVIMNSLSLVFRSILKTVSSIVIVQGLGGISWAFVQLPYMSIFYNNSKKKGIAETIFMREFYLNIGRFLVVSVLGVSLLVTSPEVALTITIILAALAMLLMAKISDDKDYTTTIS